VKTPQPQLPLITIPTVDPAPVSSRREFCARACQAASLIAAGVFVPGCGSDGSPTGPDPTSPGNAALPVLSGSVSGRTVTVPIVPTGPLSTTGGAALVTAQLLPVGSFLVARTSQATFSVLTAICTHEGCTVDLFNGELFVCPCHNSKYTTAGAVANGPASRPLQGFPSTLSGTVLSFMA